MQVNESFPFSIALTWKGASAENPNGATENHPSTVVFPKGNPIPSVKALTFYRTGTFTVDVQYTDYSEFQGAAKISSATVNTSMLIYFIAREDGLSCVNFIMKLYFPADRSFPVYQR